MPKIKRESETVSVEDFIRHMAEAIDESKRAPLYAPFAWPESGKSIFQHLLEKRFEHDA